MCVCSYNNFIYLTLRTNHTLTQRKPYAVKNGKFDDFERQDGKIKMLMMKNKDLRNAIDEYQQQVIVPIRRFRRKPAGAPQSPTRGV